MNTLFSLFTGAGLMYLFDPERGRTRRALIRDKVVRLQHEAEHVSDVVSKDMSNRLQGLRSGDYSVLVGGKNTLSNPLRGAWSPSGRAILTGLGAGMVLYGLSRRFPTACLLGTAGLAMIAEGITNAGIDDVRNLPKKVKGTLIGDGRAENSQPAKNSPSNQYSA